MLRRALPYTAGLMVCLLFGVLGLILIPYPGAQYDEVLFASAIHDPLNIECVVQLSSGLVPVMLMTYIGTLKVAIYTPLVHWFGGTNATLRLPVLAMDGVSNPHNFGAIIRTAAFLGIEHAILSERPEQAREQLG